MKQLIALLLSFSVLHSATITVCASGCTTTSVQTALNTAVGGDIVEITAGETFEGAFTLPFRTDSGVVKVRSSRWAELSPVGYRVAAATAALMPKLQATNASSPVLGGGYIEHLVSSVNLTTDVLTFSDTHGIPNDRPFACRVINTTAPLTAYQIYYARDVTSNTMKVAATPGGAAIDLTTAIVPGTAPPTPTFGCVRNDSIGGWKFQGIEFSGKVGTPTQYSLIDLNTTAFDRAGIMHDISFDRVYIHGIKEENGAKHCLTLNASPASVTDSRIEFCQREGEESHGISSFLTPGPFKVHNNYIASGAINFLLGGNYVYVPGLINGDRGKFTITSNHFHKPLYLKYRSGTGQGNVPVQSCAGSGQYSLDTSTGLLYKCKTANTWTQNPTCADDEYFRQTNASAQNCAGGACWKCASGVYVPDTVYRGAGYYVKNLYEVKHGMNMEVSGNVFENNWAGDADQSGIGVWVVSQIGNENYTIGKDINFHHNILKNSELGFRVATYGGQTFVANNSRVVVSNNIGIGIGATAYPSLPDQNSSQNGSQLQIGGKCDDCIWDHNTTYPGSTTNGNGWQFDTSAVTRLRFSNNLGGRALYGVVSGGGNACQGITVDNVIVNADDLLVNNALVDNQAQGSNGSIGTCATNTRYVAGPWSTHVTSSTDMRLKTTSPYSAANGSATYIGTDGKDLGADVDQVEAETAGAVSGLPTLHSSIKVTAGSTSAIVRYQAPDASTCSLKLYSGVSARLASNLHADTADSAKWADDRSGNLSYGTARTFVLGTVSALTASTQYQAVIACGSSIGFAWVRTRPTGAGYNAVIRYSSARTGEYSASASFSSPTAISLSNKHTVPVSATTYYRHTGGLTTVLIP